MLDPSPSILVGLEVGTSKVCAVVGELAPDGNLSIIGLGQSRSRGVRKGEIVDATVASEDIRDAIVEAEQMANVEISTVYLGVTGAHIRGFNNRGRHNIVPPERGITEADVQAVVRNAKAINLPAIHHPIHVVRQHFLVDGQDGVLNPAGMLGAQLEVDVHVVYGLYNRLHNPIRTVRTLQLDVPAIVFNGIASALAVLTPQDKELGALVIDLGAGVTEYVVYAGGIVRHTGVLAVGGDHVTNDLACGLKVPLGRAEELKIQHGSAILDDSVKGQLLHSVNQRGLPDRPVNLEHLRRIMCARLEETFQIIAEELEAAGVLQNLRAGVVLCGGGARIPHIDKLAGRILGLPVAIGRTQSISGLVSALDQPEFATGIGLVKFGSFQQEPQPPKTTLRSRLRATISHVFQLS